MKFFTTLNTMGDIKALNTIEVIEKKPLKIRSHLATGFVLPMASAFDNMIQLQLEEKG